MARIRFDDGTVIDFEGDPSPDELDEAYEHVSQLKARQTPHPIAGIAAPMGGGMLGAALGTMVAPGPGTFIGGGLGALAGEGGRELLQGEGFQPLRAGLTGLGYATIAPLFEAAAPAAEALGPLASRIGLPSLAREGAVLNTALRGGVANLGSGSLVRGLSGMAQHIPMSSIGRELLTHAPGEFGGGALLSGAWQALGPPQLGAGNYWKALGGNRAAIESARTGALQESATAEDALRTQQGAVQAGSTQEQALAEDRTRTALQQQEQATQAQRASLEQRQAATESAHLQQEAQLRAAFEQRQQESDDAFSRRLQQQERDVQTTLGTYEQQAQIAERGLERESNKQVLRVKRDIPKVRKLQADDAWKGVTEQAQAITTPYTMGDVDAAVQSEFPDDPARAATTSKALKSSLLSVAETRRIAQRRAQGGPGTEGGLAIPKFTPGGAKLSLPERLSLEKALSQLTPEQRAQAVGQLGEPTASETFSAQDLVDASSKLGQAMRQGVKTGKASIQATDLPELDARSVASRLIEDRSPAKFRGALSRGRNRWADFKNDDALHRTYFRRGQFTDEGRKFLRSIAEGTASLDDRGYFDRLVNKLGYDPTTPLRPYVTRLQTLPESVTAVKTGAKLSKQTVESMKDEVRQRLTSELKTQLGGVESSRAISRATFETDLQSLLSKSGAEQAKLRDMGKAEVSQIATRSREQSTALEATASGKTARAHESAQQTIQSLQRQARIARWIGFLGFWPLRYALINRPIAQAFRKAH